MKKRICTLCLCAALAVCLSGCFSAVLASSRNQPDWDAASYTIDDIKAMALEKNHALDDLTDDDCTSKALHAYNIMLGYADSTGVSYRVYDFYHVDFDTVKSYVIKIVLEDYAADFEAEESVGTTDNRILMICCKENGSRVESQIEPFLMARTWSEDVSRDFSDAFPDYYLNTGYISLENIVPNVTAENYDEIDDYTHFFNDHFYNGMFNFYDNEVNIFVPAGTPESEADRISEMLHPFMREHFVTDYHLICFRDAETLQRCRAEEKFSDNHYEYQDDDLNWYRSYRIYE